MSVIGWLFIVLILPLGLLWVFFRAVMTLKKIRKKRELTLLEKIVGIPVGVIGIGIDGYCHLVSMTVLTMDAPRVLNGEWTVTARFQRYLDDMKKYYWRRKLALWWKPKLNKWDLNHLK